MEGYPVIDWAEGGEEKTARWRSESGLPPPRQMAIVDDRITADQAYGLACQGTALLWRGDYQNARQLLAALGKRCDHGPRKARAATPAEAFNRHRQLQAQRARTLGMLLVELDGGHAIALRRAPDVREACREAWGEGEGPCVVSLRELLGVIGAHEWRAKGIPVAALRARVHPHYGVFTPIRQEYVDLVANAPLPAAAAGGIAFDVGTGTGVLAAVLARRGFARVVATINADGALFASDYRAPERLFSLLMQAAGRAGREAGLSESAQMWVQTWHPTHALFNALKHHDFEAFAAQQLEERQAAQMPPFSHQALLRAEARTQEAAQAFLSAAREAARTLEGAEHLMLYPPVPMTIQRVANVERAYMLLESDSRPALQRVLGQWHAALAQCRSLPEAKGLIRWAIDVDPIAI